jgi:hypothetical protein
LQYRLGSTFLAFLSSGKMLNVALAKKNITTSSRSLATDIRSFTIFEKMFIK